jgi:hypothetical protein
MNRNTIMTIIICSVVIQQQLHAKITNLGSLSLEFLQFLNF